MSKMKKRLVFVENGSHEYVKMFEEFGFLEIGTPREADLICFTGGADVSPMLYGEATLPQTMCNPERDVVCSDIFYNFMNKVPMVGICRGAQFLNVVNGGWMYQHVDNHAIGGTHEATDAQTGEIIQVTSTHHQMMIPNPDEAEMVLYAERSANKMPNMDDVDDCPEVDTECVYYKSTNSLCFQPHPEFPGEDVKECREFFRNLLEQYLF